MKKEAKKKLNSEQDEAVLKRARERWTEGYAAEKDNRERAIAALKFKVGEQWEDEVKTDRKGRPMITVNKLPQFVRRVVNEQRQNRPGMKIRGAGGGADNEIARTYEGLIRNIENQSDFETIVDDSLEKVVDCGYGAWRILTDFEDDRSFDQECKIVRIKNQFNVLIDPAAQMFDKSDKRWAFIGETMRYDDAKAEFGDDISYSSFSEIPDGSRHEGWFMKGEVRIAEYFELLPKKETICLYSDGRETKVIAAPDKIKGEKVDPEEYFSAYAQENGLEKLKTRKVDSHKVMWYKITGTEILDRRELKGRFIPVVTCYGDVTVVDGKEIINGLIEFAKDPMRMYNYWVSSEAELLGIQNKAPYVAAAEQVQDYKDDWTNANKKNLAVLRYKHIQGLPVPQRQQPPQGSQGIVQAAVQMSGDLNETTGIYPPTLGQRSNETSGIAIQKREQQGEIGTFHYVDNINRAVKFTGRILVDLIPHIYDTPRIIRILGEDGKDEMVPINQKHPTKQDDDGQPLIVDLGQGKYDVVVEAGPSFNTQREEFANLLLELIKTNPAMLQLVGDLLFGNLDIKGAEQIAERLKKLIPPEIQGTDEVGAQNNAGLPVNPAQAQPGGVF